LNLSRRYSWTKSKFWIWSHLIRTSLSL